MELRKFNNRLANLFLPLDDKVKGETATEKEIIEHHILEKVFLWSEWITVNRTKKERESMRLVSKAAAILKKRPESGAAMMEKCRWRYNEERDVYFTSCASSYQGMNDGTDGFKFCPYCGKELEEVDE